MTDNKFSILESSDLDYEKMVVNINLGDTHFATLNCDNGINETEIVIFEKYNNNISWTLDFHEFMKILNRSFEKLKSINSCQLE